MWSDTVTCLLIFPDARVILRSKKLSFYLSVALPTWRSLVSVLHFSLMSTWQSECKLKLNFVLCNPVVSSWVWDPSGIFSFILIIKKELYFDRPFSFHSSCCFCSLPCPGLTKQWSIIHWPHDSDSIKHNESCVSLTTEDFNKRKLLFEGCQFFSPYSQREVQSTLE